MDRRGFQSRFNGAFVGALVGDALGAPFRGHSPYLGYSRYGDADSFYPNPEGSNLETGEYTHLSRLMLYFATTIDQNEGRLMKPEHLHEKVAQWNTANAWPGHIQTAIDSIREKRPGLHDPMSEVVAIGIVMGILASARPVDDQKVFGACRAATGWLTSDPQSLLCCFVVAKIIRECIKNYETMPGPRDLFESDKSLFFRTIEVVKALENTSVNPSPDPLWARLDFARKKLFEGLTTVGLNGYCYNTGVMEATTMAVFSFFRCPDDFSSVTAAAQVGGDASLSAMLTGAFCGAYSGIGVFSESIRHSTIGTGKVLGLSESLMSKVLPETMEQ